MTAPPLSAATYKSRLSLVLLTYHLQIRSSNSLIRINFPEQLTELRETFYLLVYHFFFLSFFFFKDITQQQPNGRDAQDTELPHPLSQQVSWNLPGFAAWKLSDPHLSFLDFYRGLITYARVMKSGAIGNYTLRAFQKSPH